MTNTAKALITYATWPRWKQEVLVTDHSHKLMSEKLKSADRLKRHLEKRGLIK